jgi:protein gp37
MSDGSKIEWLHDGVKKALTWNPTTGCTKVSAGCKNCYAKKEWIRLSANPKSVYYGRKFEDVAMHPERLIVPLLMTKPRRIFVDSMSDLFHDDIEDMFIVAVLGVAAIASQHTFIILTKRADRMRVVLCMLSNRSPRHDIAAAFKRYGLEGYIDKLPQTLTWPLPNVQLGVSVESREFLPRVVELRKTPAAVRVISAEPLLEDLGEFDLAGIDQVFGGGESGHKARPSTVAALRSLRDQCRHQGTAFFFKQWGEWAPASEVAKEHWRNPHDYVDGVYMMRVGKKNAGRKLDGVEHSELVA